MKLEKLKIQKKKNLEKLRKLTKTHKYHEIGCKQAVLYAKAAAIHLSAETHVVFGIVDSERERHCSEKSFQSRQTECVNF